MSSKEVEQKAWTGHEEPRGPQRRFSSWCCTWYLWLRRQRRRPRPGSGSRPRAQRRTRAAIAAASASGCSRGQSWASAAASHCSSTAWRERPAASPWSSGYDDGGCWGWAGLLLLLHCCGGGGGTFAGGRVPYRRGCTRGKLRGGGTLAAGSREAAAARRRWCCPSKRLIVVLPFHPFWIGTSAPVRERVHRMGEASHAALQLEMRYPEGEEKCTKQAQK